LGLTNIGLVATPLNITLVEATKLAPVIESVCAADPMVTEAGDIVVTMGTGFFTVKLEADDTPPPGAGFETMTA